LITHITFIAFHITFSLIILYFHTIPDYLLLAIEPRSLAWFCRLHIRSYNTASEGGWLSTSILRAFRHISFQPLAISLGFHYNNCRYLIRHIFHYRFEYSHYYDTGYFLHCFACTDITIYWPHYFFRHWYYAITTQITPYYKGQPQRLMPATGQIGPLLRYATPASEASATAITPATEGHFHKLRLIQRSAASQLKATQPPQPL